ncbi:KdsC family phosphatase [Scytonema sp. NUACC26]|uniref:KdsC family phosphatase n=1 Tax=Scytonema sp. NUACC26 TaxID=3140176 RepID=UPI0034DCB35B
MSDNSNPELHKRLSQVKLLALDVDGVLTDGGLYYTDSGEELKKFNVKDGQGIKLVMQAGVEVAIVTTSTSHATLHRAKKLGIKHTFIGAEDKLTVIKKLCEDLSLSLSQVAYVGDDIVDLPVMCAVGCPLTVADAMPDNQACAVYVSRLAGGQGCVREICDLLLKTKSKVEARLSLIEK